MDYLFFFSKAVFLLLSVVLVTNYEVSEGRKTV
jgi:hypothetical protein